MEKGMAITTASFEQQHFDPGVFAQAPGQYATGRSTASDDVVKIFGCH